ncbi:hypothetical protein Q8F55_006713 [Vanrija albida]|uniref:Cation-transporting P-type ATPase N-terminal domain-containing protein n=1 Tax=Vanrija albida TaxID=181172 RepID=A0ABR3PXY3_9TREE
MSLEKHASDSTQVNHQKEELPKSGSSDMTAVVAVGAGKVLTFSPHTALPGKVLEALDVDAQVGLSEEEAARRLETYGPNRIKPPPKPSLIKICARQVANAMTLILIACMAVSFGTLDWISGGVIAALIILNITVGTITEWEAEKTVASLESVGAPIATVVRHSSTQTITKQIAVDEVVPGDIIQVKNGDIIPADGRVLDGVSNLECDEAFLTGESLPVAKQSEPVDEENCPVGDRVSMVFSGAQVTKGRSFAVVTATGMETEIGTIAKALQTKAARTETGWAAFVRKTKVALGLADTTPLQIKLNSLAYILLIASLVIAVVVVASTGFKNVPMTMATYAVAAAVSILPASLIAVVSLTLARASTDLAKRHALVRRMDAIEALAGVANVCSDKTGTLTVGRMVVRKAWVPVLDARESATAPTETTRGQTYSFETGSDPFYPRGEITPDTAPLIPSGTFAIADRSGPDSSDDDLAPIEPSTMEESLRDLAICAGLCNQATLTRPTEDEGWEANGDPTEIALQVAAHKLGFGKPYLTGTAAHSKKCEKDKKADPMGRRASLVRAEPINGHYEQIVEHPFDSTIKRMSIAYRFVPHTGMPPKILCLLKGAVERVIDCCSTVRDQPMTDGAKADIMKKVDALASHGLRVLALCGKYAPMDAEEAIKTTPREEFEQNFAFLGLVGIFDPPRKESPGAVADCHRAGITPRMLTGDHPSTATAIALQIGILDKTYSKSAVMTGQQFDALTDAEVDALDDLPLVVARCAPETKVRMVDAIHRRKETTVMTGDGVNDSPALKRADVGVAMGTGSDVAKQAARIVLTDDNFASAIRAIRKGRSVFKNLSKFLLYLLSGNVAEIIVLMIGLAFKDENGQSVFPMSPVAALWINTLAAGPPAMALGLEPTATDAMDLPPTTFQRIFTLEFYVDLLFYGVVIGSVSLVNFVIVLWGYFPGDLGKECNERHSPECDPVFLARSTCFATLVIILMIHSLECKHTYNSMFRTNMRDNKVLLWCVVVLTLSTFPVVYIPVINDKVFLMGSLKWEWGIVFGMILVYLGATEAYKWGKRIYARRHLVKPKHDPYDKTLGMEKTIDYRDQV